MDKTIDTPSREIDLGNIPVHLRTALRRALEFEARAPAPRSAEEAEQCEEQLRVRTIRRPPHPRAATRGWAPPRLATPPLRSDGLETANAGHDAVEKLGTDPAGAASTTVAASWPGCKPRGLLAGAAPLRRHRPGYQDPPLDRLTLRGRAAQQSAACGLLDRVRQAGGRLPRRGPRPRDWPQDEEGAQPIPYRPSSSCTSSATTGDRLKVGPDHRRHAPGTVGPAVVVRAAVGLNAADKVLFIADALLTPPAPHRRARALADTGAGADRLLSCRQATLRRGQAAPLERDATHPLAQPHAGAAQASTRGRGDHGPAGACRGRTAGKIRTHLNYS